MYSSGELSALETMLLLIATMLFTFSSGDEVGKDGATYIWKVPTAPTYFRVHVGVHIVYDKAYDKNFFRESNGKQNLVDYFTALTKAAECRFLNGNFATVRLVFTGSTLFHKFDLFKVHHDEYGIRMLDPKKTLEKLKEHVKLSPFSFPKTDLLLFVTGEEIKEEFYLTTLTKTARGGVCTDENVGFFYDDGKYFSGTLGMAQEIATLLGASVDSGGVPDLLYKPLEAGRCGLSPANWIELKMHVMDMKYSLYNPRRCLQDFPVPARPELPFQYLLKETQYCERVGKLECAPEQGKSDNKQLAHIPILSKECWLKCCEESSYEDNSFEDEAQDVYVPKPDGSPCYVFAMCVSGYCVNEDGDLVEPEAPEPERKRDCPPPKNALTQILRLTPNNN